MIVIVVDGLTLDLAERYFDLPLDNLVKDSWFPTLTGCVHLSMLTGRSPAENNIPSMRWMDRRRGGKRTYFNLTGTIDRDYAGSTMATDFSSSISIFSPLSRGFTSAIPPLGHALSHMANTWLPFDRLAIKLFERYAPRYDFKFLCLYSVDELSHRFGLGSKRSIKACKLLNEQINEIIKRRDGTEEIIVTSDHGLTQTHSHIDLVKLFKKAGYRARGFPFYLGSQEVFIAVCGNSMAHIYLNGGGDPKKVIELLEEVKGIDRVFTENQPENDDIFKSARTGNIVVTAEPGYDLRVWEIPEHKASHGSTCEEHYKIPVFTNKKMPGSKVIIKKG